MAVRSRFCTRTVVDSKYLVPWLAAEGPLAYSPVEPPAKDYFFQYGWILPEIFDQKVNLRQHRYFGSPLKETARFLFDFWAKVRGGAGAALQRYCEFGFLSQQEVRTPLAAYHSVRKPYNTAGFVLIQHGSYQWISSEDQCTRTCCGTPAATSSPTRATTLDHCNIIWGTRISRTPLGTPTWPQTGLRVV